jgi:hypothetical protein
MELGVGKSASELSALRARLHSVALKPAFDAGRNQVVSPVGHALPSGSVHEWIGVVQRCTDPTFRPRHGWSPPLTLLLQCAQATCDLQPDRCVLWVGDAVWPFPSVILSMLTRNRGIGASYFVRARTTQDRLWAADLALRSGVAAAVIVDGSCFDIADTRRLQLAAECRGGTCLLARPPWEASQLSAASTRWLVRTAHSPTGTRRWSVELLRCKTHGFMNRTAIGRSWMVESDHATRTLRVVADVCDGSGQAQDAQNRVARTG